MDFGEGRVRNAHEHSGICLFAPHCSPKLPDIVPRNITISMNAFLDDDLSPGCAAFDLRRSPIVALLLTLTLLLVGCSTSTPTFQYSSSVKMGPAQPEPLVLREGDVVRIEFPGAPTLNTREPIKRDGKIMLLKGEVTAAGKTVAELQKDILELYSPDLITKLVVVSVEASTFPIYVTGAVSKSGQFIVDRPLTVLEAVMQAGVDLSKANLKAVRVSRSINGEMKIYMLNLHRLLIGKDLESKPFYVSPSDIIYVPEKFQWF
jgi:polysaccharide biosynthesis/export protein